LNVLFKLNIRWYLVVAYSLIWLTIAIIFIALYGVDITAETTARKIFAVRLALFFWALISATLISILLHLYFRKLKLLEERDQLIAEMRDTLAQTRTLRGLVTVCSYCKRVRNDKGYWEQIERYIINNSHAKFSHGICTECMAKIETKVCSLNVVMPADK